MLGKNRKNNYHGHSGDPEVGGVVAHFEDQYMFAKRCLPAIPRNVGSDLSFTTFPDTIDPQTAAEALRRKLMIFS